MENCAYIVVKTRYDEVLSIGNCGGDAVEYCKRTVGKVLAIGVGDDQVVTYDLTGSLRGGFPPDVLEQLCELAKDATWAKVGHHFSFTAAAWEHTLKLPKLAGPLVDTEELARRVYKAAGKKSRSFSLNALSKDLGTRQRFPCDHLEGKHTIEELVTAAARDVEAIRELHNKLVGMSAAA